MCIEEKEIQKIAYLARIALTEKDAMHYRESFCRILSLVDRIQRVDTTNIEPLSNPLEMTQRLREDATTEEFHQKDLINAPQKESGFFLVPKVI